jgi:urease accessory protein UreH
VPQCTLSKPHDDSDTLVVNVVNATAGLLAGDRIECHVEVETGASLLLTSLARVAHIGCTRAALK